MNAIKQNAFVFSVGGAAATAAALFMLNQNKEQNNSLAAQSKDTKQTQKQNKKNLKIRPTGDMAVFTQGASPLDLEESGGRPL